MYSRLWPKFLKVSLEGYNRRSQRPVAQLAERRSPKPQVVGSIPSGPASFIMNSTLNNILWLVSLTAAFAAVILFTYLEDLGLLYRVLMLVGLMTLSLGVLGQTGFGKNAVKLISDARTEIAKVVWPGRGETTQMTIMVLVMILILALIFWGLDSLLSFLSRFILG